jgi:DNA mismatch repair ATPase MutS
MIQYMFGLLIVSILQVEGPSEGSYGINVARLAGIDRSILAKAIEVSQRMLKQHHHYHQQQLLTSASSSAGNCENEKMDEEEEEA